MVLEQSIAKVDVGCCLDLSCAVTWLCLLRTARPPSFHLRFASPRHPARTLDLPASCLAAVCFQLLWCMLISACIRRCPISSLLQPEHVISVGNMFFRKAKPKYKHICFLIDPQEHDDQEPRLLCTVNDEVVGGTFLPLDWQQRDDHYGLKFLEKQLIAKDRQGMHNADLRYLVDRAGEAIKRGDVPDISFLDLASQSIRNWMPRERTDPRDPICGPADVYYLLVECNYPDSLWGPDRMGSSCSVM